LPQQNDVAIQVVGTLPVHFEQKLRAAFIHAVGFAAD
jgi:hypothetical protein